MSYHQETTLTVYHFIQAYYQENRKSPTIREIASACYVSVGTVFRHLDKLELMGYIQREPNQARSIILLRSEG
jgi:DNA-binding MarR family transcriptional regulator